MSLLTLAADMMEISSIKFTLTYKLWYGVDTLLLHRPFHLTSFVPPLFRTKEAEAIHYYPIIHF